MGTGATRRWPSICARPPASARTRKSHSARCLATGAPAAPPSPAHAHALCAPCCPGYCAPPHAPCQPARPPLSLSLWVALCGSVCSALMGVGEATAGVRGLVLSSCHVVPARPLLASRLRARSRRVCSSSAPLRAPPHRPLHIATTRTFPQTRPLCPCRQCHARQAHTRAHMHLGTQTCTHTHTHTLSLSLSLSRMCACIVYGPCRC
jgi:hypothetical protein